MKIHDMNRIIVNSIQYSYFYEREKNDRNGNPRYTVYIIDPDGGAVYEKVFTTYNLGEAVKTYVENKLWEDV